MKVLFAALLGCVIASSAIADTYVQGYYRSNGTYVQPHYRTSPNSTINDNYTTRPNVNPYNGNVGTRQPSYGSSRPSSSYGYGMDNSESGCTENGVRVDC